MAVAGMAIVLLAAGCSDGNATAPVDVTAETSTSATTQTTPTRSTSSGTPAQAPEAGAEAREEWLMGWAQSRGISDPPEVPVVREVRPEEMGALVVQCLTDQGFDAEFFPEDDSWGLDAAPGQGEAAALAEYICIAQHPLMDVFVLPLSDDRLRASYVWHVETTIPCLQGMGHSTPEPPTLETYIATYRATGGQWMAQAEAALPHEAWEECPPLPPTGELFPTGSEGS